MKFKILIGLFMMLGLSVGVNAQSFLSPEDAVEAIEIAVANIDSHDLSVDIPTAPTGSLQTPVPTVTNEQVKAAFTTFLTELEGSIKTFSDTQAGYDDVVARFTSGTNGNAYRVAGLDAAKSFALQIIAN